MRLIKLHITNFGRFHDYDMDFSDGLNSFLQENGWGKTTLSVFLKAMFYGFNSAGRTIANNDRKKYKPWQGGNFGGWLDFSDGQKEYKVSRTFGDKASDDIFELRDLSTNKVCQDYPNDIGTKLFGVNEDTFSRTIYITLEATPTGSADLSAKLNSLVEAQDMGAYDEAMKKLDGIVKNLKSPNRQGTGEIPRLQDKIEDHRQFLINANNLLSDNEKISSDIAGLETKLENLNNDQKEISELLTANIKYKEKLAYLQLKESKENLSANADDIRDFFNNQIPDEQTLSQIDKASADLNVIQATLEKDPVTQSDRDTYSTLLASFKGDIPDDEQIKKVLDTDSLYKKYLQEKSRLEVNPQALNEFNTLNALFTGKEIDSAKIHSAFTVLESLGSLENQLTRQESELEIAKAKQANKKAANPAKIVLFALSGIFIFAAIAGAMNIIPGLTLNPFSYARILVPAFCAAAGVITGILAIVCKTKKPAGSETELQNLQINIEETRSLLQNKKNSLAAFTALIYPGENPDISLLSRISTAFDRYKTLLEEVTSFKDFEQHNSDTEASYKNELTAFTTRYLNTTDISNIPSLTNSLSDKLNQLKKLKDRIDTNARLMQEKDSSQAKLKEILGMYKTSKTQDYAFQVREIHEKSTTLKNTLAALESAQIKCSEFEKNNDVKALENLQAPEQTSDDLNEQFDINLKAIQNYTAQKSRLESLIEQNLETTDKIADIQDALEQTCAEKLKKEEEHRIYSLAQKFLGQAKEKIDEQFAAPMKKGFEKYAELLGAKESLVIDTELKVKIDHEGKIYDSEFLSTGYKDLINLCSRLALIDALYPENKPPVILDDPFVNLDNDKTQKAVNLLTEIAKDKQLVYLTCHDSRKPC